MEEEQGSPQSDTDIEINVLNTGSATIALPTGISGLLNTVDEVVEEDSEQQEIEV